MGMKGSFAFVGIALLAFLTKTLVLDFRAFEPIKPFSKFTDCKKLDCKSLVLFNFSTII